MIIPHYIINKITQNLFILFIVLFLALIGNDMNDILNKVASGYINLFTGIHALLYLSISIVSLILPVSLFLGIYISLKQLFKTNELLVIQAFGLSWKQLFVIILKPTLVITTFSLMLSFFIVPYALMQLEILNQKTAIKSISNLKPGKFYVITNNQSAFVDYDNNTKHQSIFLANLGKVHDLITFSPNYRIDTLSNHTYLNMHNGWRIEINTTNNAACKMNFSSGLFSLEHYVTTPRFKINVISTSELVKQHDLKATIELRWRLLMGLLPLIALLFVLPFSDHPVRKQNHYKIIVAIVSFLGFYVLTCTLKNMFVTNELSSRVGFEIPSYIVLLAVSLWIIIKDQSFPLSSLNWLIFRFAVRFDDH